MYGASLSKDLNLSIQQQQQPVTGVRTPPQMSSPGLLRYRSAPSTMLGDVCGDFIPTGDGHRQAGSPDQAADTVFARFLAAPPRPAVAPSNLFSPDTAASMASQQQLMYQSQQQMAAMESLYRTNSSGGPDPAAAAGGGSNGLLRQSSSPPGSSII